jgi:hypothetical protein
MSSNYESSNNLINLTLDELIKKKDSIKSNIIELEHQIFELKNILPQINDILKNKCEHENIDTHRHWDYHRTNTEYTCAYCKCYLQFREIKKFNEP